MQCRINEKLYTYCDAVKDDPAVRRSFDELAGRSFGLSFESWYRAGYWTDAYVPHALLYEDRVVANVSVSVMDFLYERQPKRFIQFGTVMTDPAYRHQGLARFLMEGVIEEWKPQCDGMYLYANDSAVEFYPRFGFRKAEETEHSLPISGGKGNAVKLDMDSAADIELLLRMFRRGNPFSKLSMLRNEGLLMFYCTQFLRDDVYYCPDFDAVVIAGFCGSTMLCQGIFGGEKADMLWILHSAAAEKTETVRFGFTPKETDQMRISPPRYENTTFF